MMQIQLLPLELTATYAEKVGGWHIENAPYKGLMLPKDFAAPLIVDLGIEVFDTGLIREKNTTNYYSLDVDGWTNLNTGHRFAWKHDGLGVTRYSFTEEHYERVNLGGL